MRAAPCVYNTAQEPFGVFVSRKGAGLQANGQEKTRNVLCFSPASRGTKVLRLRHARISTFRATPFMIPQWSHFKARFR